MPPRGEIDPTAKKTIHALTSSSSRSGAARVRHRSRATRAPPHAPLGTQVVLSRILTIKEATKLQACAWHRELSCPTPTGDPCGETGALPCDFEALVEGDNDVAHQIQQVSEADHLAAQNQGLHLPADIRHRRVRGGGAEDQDRERAEGLRDYDVPGVGPAPSPTLAS